jgi:hypothetical protein
MKKIVSLSILVSSLNLTSPVYSDDSTKPMLVVDAKNTFGLPRKFRQCTSSYLEHVIQKLTCKGIEIPTREGLRDLRISGSAQFSQKQLEAVIKQTPGKLWIVDLREESHGYLNGEAICWFGGQNNANKGLDVSEILADEHTLLDKLRALKTAVVYQIQTKMANYICKANATSTPVGSIMSEAKLARLEHVNYVRFPVTDHHAPSPEIVQQFIEFYQHLPKDAYLLFHCRGGNGRTSFFMTLCDILKNGHELSFQEILLRQYLLGGRNILKDSDPSANVVEGSEAYERFILLQDLYEQITGKPADIDL